MLILYITYVDMSGGSSGSGVRPQKMYRAFLDEGHEVKLLSGTQQRWDREARTAAVKEVSRWLDENRPDLCYIESPSNPILFRCDIALIRKLQRQKIPTGFFYRDYFYKFPELFAPRRGFVGRTKDLYLRLLRGRMERVMRKCSVVYFPSEEAASLFAYPVSRLLPPGGENRLDGCAPQNDTAIYVGGLTGTYNGGRILDTFCALNKEEIRQRLILVCRESEWNALKHPAKNAPWLEVHHASGEELVPLYRRAGYAIAMYDGQAYANLAVSVKLYEYLSYGLPILVSGSAAMERIVRETGAGICSALSVPELAGAVEELTENRSIYAQRAAAALLGGNLWTDRVKQIVRDLTGR